MIFKIHCSSEIINGVSFHSKEGPILHGKRPGHSTLILPCLHFNQTSSSLTCLKYWGVAYNELKQCFLSPPPKKKDGNSLTYNLSWQDLLKHNSKSCFRQDEQLNDKPTIY